MDDHFFGVRQIRVCSYIYKEPKGCNWQKRTNTPRGMIRWWCGEMRASRKRTTPNINKIRRRREVAHFLCSACRGEERTNKKVLFLRGDPNEGMR